MSNHELLLSTTGNGDVALKDLGIVVPDPTTDLNLLVEFQIEDIRRSDYLQTAITNGDVTLISGDGFTVTDLMDDLFPVTNCSSIAQNISDDSESTTTSSDWQHKLRLTTPSLTSGHEYRVGWYYEVAQSNTSDAIESRVQLNDTTTICGALKEPKDKTDWIPISGFYYSSSLSGVNTIDIDYREQRGGTAKIRSARLELWRTK